MVKLELHDALFGYEVEGRKMEACEAFTATSFAALAPSLLDGGRLDYLAINDIDDTSVVVYDYSADVVEVLGRVSGDVKGTYVPVHFKVDVDGNVETERLEGRLGFDFVDGFAATFPGVGSAIAIAERLRSIRDFEADMRTARRRARTWFVVDEGGKENVFETLYRAELYRRGLKELGRYGTLFQRARAATPSDWEGPCCEDPEEE